MNTKDFKFTYELDENFTAFTTMPVVIAHKELGAILTTPGLPEINPMMFLHGEEVIELYKPINAGMKIEVQEKVVDVQDKGSGAAIFVEGTLTDTETKEVVAKVLMTGFGRGIGGFGYKGTIKSQIPAAPKRAPDSVQEETTQPNQAILYRLNADYNPLHIDPNMAAMGGFDKPIIHGLCTFGFSARAIFEKYCDGDQMKIAKFGGRFTSHFFPGETFVVESWKEGNTVVFETKVKERGKTILKGFAELREGAKL